MRPLKVRNLAVLANPALHWILFLVCLAAMLYGTFRPEPPPDLFAHSDKVGHGLGYTALTLTARMALNRMHRLIFWPAMAGFAVLLEFLQAAWRPLRVFSLGDAYANLLGVGIALAIVALWHLLGRPLASSTTTERGGAEAGPPRPHH